MATQKVTQKDLETVLGGEYSEPGKLSLSKGIFTIRKGFYWSPKYLPEESFGGIVVKLETAGYKVTAIDYGRHDAPFRGGEGVKKNSHYWMKFKVAK